MQFDSVYYLSTHVLLYQWRQLRGIVFGFKIWSDPYAALPGFVHLTKGPFSHERCSHASLSFSLSLCHVMPCHATPCRIMSRRTRPRQADVVPPIYHPLSFPPILAAPFAEQWKCIDRRMARAGKRTGFPSQPPTPSLCLSLSLPFRLVVSFLLLVLHSFLPPSVYLPLLWNTFRVFPLSLSPPVPPLFPSFMERRCLHPSISKREMRRSILLVATLVAVRVDYHFCTVAGSPFFPSFGGKYLCRCIVSRDLPLFPRLVFPLPA